MQTFTPAARFLALMALGSVLLLLSQPLLAQQGAGAASKLTGQVVDPSGAAMPNVAVELEELGTSAKRATTSNEAGFYFFDQLSRGTYKLTARAPGFAEATISSVQLEVRQVASLNVTMKPGEVIQTVEVSASALRLESQTSDISPLLATKLLTQLPTSFRNPVELVGLIPGVTQVRTRGGATNDPFSATTTWGRSNFTVGGGFKNTSAFLVDGVDAGHSYSAGGMGMNVIISPDTIEEFKLHIFNYSAEFGNGNGAMNLITKSGNNGFHGAVSYFHQNRALNANNFFNNARSARSPFLIRHQYNYAIGGPVYIPKLYDGRNKTFFFTDWGEMRQPNTTIFLNRVPTEAEKRGDFSNLYSTSGAPINIYNPFDTFTDVDGRIKRRVFPNNQIPASMISAFSRNLMNYFPRPNRPGGELGPGGLRTEVNNFYATPPNNFILQEFNVKIDHNFNDKHRITARVSQNPQPLTCLPVERTTYGTLGSPERCFSQTPSYSNLSHTWSVTPNFLVTQSVYTHISVLSRACESPGCSSASISIGV
ncbi:MAG: TonB-dependent receptor [Armatimonadetes bacterium]|nr:TonB-dependent receptor [Armatimonadota bacterium]